MSFEPLTEERIETDSTYDAGTTTQLVGCPFRRRMRTPAQ